MYLTMNFFFTPLLLMINCFFIFFFKKWMGPMGMFLSSLVITLMTFFSFIFYLNVMLLSGSYVYMDFGRWFFMLDLLDSNLMFMFDNLSCLVSSLVLFLALFAQYFGSEYMYSEAFMSSLLYLLNMFITSVIFLFLVFDFFLVLVVWELMGLFSLLLVNYYSTRVYTLKAALKTFLLSRLSDAFIFFSFLMFIIFFYSTDFSIIFLKMPFFLFYNIYFFSWGIHLLTLMSMLMTSASAIKAAQFIFHTWLPDAMEAPTPASALMHSSTLVIMGMYFMMRFNILFEFSQLANLFLILLGSFTIAFGAMSASFQNDMKKLVAYSTISQMGYLFSGCGFLCYNEVMFYLSMHALNKAFLFMLVGYIVHFFNSNTDLSFMGSLYFYSYDIVFMLFMVSLNLTGLPYTSGFLSKEFLLFQTLKDQFLVYMMSSCWFVSFFFTPVYMLLINIYVFFYSKNSPNSLFLNLHISQYSKFFKSSYYETFDYSQVYSKLTGFVLLLLFMIVNVTGESYLLMLLEFFSLSDTMVNHSVNHFTISSMSTNALNSSMLTWYILYGVLLSLYSGLSYLKNIML